MEKQINSIRYQMIGTVASVFILGGWQYSFVYKGFISNPWVIGAILVGFVFSCVMAFIFITKLDNEVVAFRALKEMWDDIRMESREGQKDPLWRHYRCASPARVFHRPRILGHAYDLVTEELARTKKIRVSVETMNTLVHKVEQSIADERSLLVYMSGLLVFMGLIGTFIGLLKMVGSIGGILGALQTTGGGGNASDAFQKLLSDLQAPLAGMTTGFAASLFGLFGSLIVGLLARFAGQAAGVLKHEFEAWLAGVVQIGEDEEAAPVAASAAIASVTGDASMMQMVANVLHDYSRVAGAFEHTTKMLAEMRAAQVAHTALTERMLGELARIQTTQTRVLGEVSALVPIAPALRDLGSGLENFGSMMSRRIEADVGQLREMLSDNDRNHAAALRMVSTNQLQTTTQMASAIERLSADIDRRTAAPSSALLEQTLDRSVRTGLAEVGRVLASHSDRIEARTAEIAAGQDKLIEAIAASKGASGGSSNEEIEKLGHTFETAMADGFGRMSQSLETAFSAYSSLLHVTIGARGATAAAPAPAEIAAAPAQAPAVPAQASAASAQVSPASAPAAPALDPAPAPGAEPSTDHFDRESEELERLLSDFRMRAAGGRSS